MLFNLQFILLLFFAECIVGMMLPSSSQNQPLQNEAAAQAEMSEEEKTFRKIGQVDVSDFIKLTKFLRKMQAKQKILENTPFAYILELFLKKLLKAIVLDVEFGRPYFYAQLLNEKIQKLRVTNWAEKMFVIDYPDLFSNLTRIVLTRAPVDLADVALAYKSLYSIELVKDMTGISRRHYPFDASDGHQILNNMMIFIKWALHEDSGPLPASRI